MTSYSCTTAYKSVLGMGLFETAQAAKLADLTEAARNLHRVWPDRHCVAVSPARGAGLPIGQGARRTDRQLGHADG